MFHIQRLKWIKRLEKVMRLSSSTQITFYFIVLFESLKKCVATIQFFSDEKKSRFFMGFIMELFQISESSYQRNNIILRPPFNCENSSQIVEYFDRSKLVGSFKQFLCPTSNLKLYIENR